MTEHPEVEDKPETHDILSEEFGDIDVDNYNFDACPTRLDPIGPFYRADVYAAITKYRGHIANAAAALGRRRGALNRYLQANPDLNEVSKDIEESDLDDIEQKSMTLAKAGDGAQIRYILDRKAKNRGYSTRIEHTGKDGRNLLEVVEANMTEEQYSRLAKEHLIRSGDATND